MVFIINRPGFNEADSWFIFRLVINFVVPSSSLSKSTSSIIMDNHNTSMTKGMEQFSKMAPNKIWPGTWQFWKKMVLYVRPRVMSQGPFHSLARSCWFKLTIFSFFVFDDRQGIFFPHYENVNMISHSSCSKKDANPNVTTDHFSVVSCFSSENVWN